MWSGSDKTRKVIFFLFACLFLAGCVSLPDPETSQVHNQDVLTTLDQAGSTVVSQEILPRRSNLDSLTIYLSRPQDSSFQTGSLVVDLFFDLQDSEPAYHTVLSTEGIEVKTPLKITLPHRSLSPNQSIFIVLRASGQNFFIHGRLEETYAPGKAFINGMPVNADLAFQTTYRYDWREFIDDLRMLAGDLWLILPLLIIIFLPGWVILEFSGLRQRFTPVEWVGLSSGISLSIIPLLLMWSSLAGFSWSSEVIWFAAGFLVALTLFRKVISRFAVTSVMKGVSPPKSTLSAAKILSIAPMLVIFGITLATRLIMTRDMATPAWVDSVHHALVTRNILSTGTYPLSPSNSLDFQPTDYHLGFHSIVASLVWLTGLSLPKAMLILGQVLNALSVCAVYLVAFSLTKDHRAGLLAALLTGLFTPMPAYYTSWGRYTQLTGLIILPAVFALWKKLIDKGATSDWKAAWLPGMMAAGLFLIHYRVTAFLVLLIFADVINQLAMNIKKAKALTMRFIILSLPACAAGILLAFPWLFPALNQTILPKLTNSIPQQQGWFYGFSWGYLDAGLGEYTLILAALGLLTSLVLRRPFSLTVLVWTCLLLLFPNLNMLSLPGSSLVNITTIEITLFMPISILGGYFLSLCYEGTRSRLPQAAGKAFSWTTIAALAVLMIVGINNILPILNPFTMLSRQADLEAIEWIEHNIPPGETIVINPFSWGYGLYAGSDGGYWITPMTGHPTLPPPVLYALSGEEKVERITQWCERIMKHGKEPEKIWEMMKAADVHYVFIGARGGVISPNLLLESPHFEPIYMGDGTFIFKTKP